jgi:hypothetical protein
LRSQLHVDHADAVVQLKEGRRDWHRPRPNPRQQCSPWKTAWMISGQNSFTMPNTPSRTICALGLFDFGDTSERT